MYFAANVTQQATLGQDTPLNPGSKQTFFSSNMCLHYSHAPGEELAEGVLGGVVGDLLYQRGPVHLGGCVLHFTIEWTKSLVCRTVVDRVLF